MTVRNLGLELLDQDGQGVDEFEFSHLIGDPLGGGEPRAGEYTGIKALMLAMLEEGVQSYMGAEPRARADAEHWVMSRRSAPFSFRVVCDTLGLEATAVRIALSRLRDTDRPRRGFSRSRPNVRRNGRLIARGIR